MPVYCMYTYIFEKNVSIVYPILCNSEWYSGIIYIHTAYMYMCVYICLYTCIYVSIHTHIDICTYVYAM